MATIYGVAKDYDYAGKRERLTVWSGPFASLFEADALSLPKGDGYMVTLRTGEKIRVTSPVGRDDKNYREIDSAINAAINEHELVNA